jgi:hypothetical protein
MVNNVPAPKRQGNEVLETVGKEATRHAFVHYPQHRFCNYKALRGDRRRAEIGANDARAWFSCATLLIAKLSTIELLDLGLGFIRASRASLVRTMAAAGTAQTFCASNIMYRTLSHIEQ